MLRISTATAGTGKESATEVTMPTAPLPAVTKSSGVGAGISNMLSSARPGFLRGLSRNPSTAGNSTLAPAAAPILAATVTTSGVDHPLQGNTSAPHLPMASSEVTTTSAALAPTDLETVETPAAADDDDDDTPPLFPSLLKDLQHEARNAEKQGESSAFL